MKNFTQVPNDMIHDPRLSPKEFRILAILMSFPKDKTHPSISYLAKCSGMSESSASRCIKGLAKKNIISWIPGSYREKRANFYSVNDRQHWRLQGKRTKLSKILHSHGDHEDHSQGDIPLILIRDFIFEAEYYASLTDAEMRILADERWTTNIQEETEYKLTKQYLNLNENELNAKER